MDHDIAVFAAARLDEDERFLRVMSEAGERTAAAATAKDLSDTFALVMQLMSGPAARQEIGRREENPVLPPTATVRAQAAIQAQRDLLARHSPFAYAGRVICNECSPADVRTVARLYPCRTARIIVATWSAHPDYRPEWKP